MAVGDLSRKAREKERGLAILDVREAARLTQNQLAELLDVSSQTVSNMERGYSGNSDIRRLEMVAEVCKAKGWLPDDFDAILEYLQGSRKDLPVVMRRRHVGPGGTGGGATVDSAETHLDTGGYLAPETELRTVVGL